MTFQKVVLFELPKTLFRSYKINKLRLPSKLTITQAYIDYYSQVQLFVTESDRKVL